MLLISNITSVCRAGNEDWERKQLDYWHEKYSQFQKTQPSKEQEIEQLGNFLRVLGFPYKYPTLSSEVAEFRSEIQQRLLQMPEHADYFLNKIKKEQMSVEHLPKKPMGERIAYDDNREKYIEYILVHLPSAETIRVLGELLWDDKDAHEKEPGDDWSPPVNNSLLAARALSKIGLRGDYPKPAQSWEGPNIERWRAWYDEIKSGKRSFSFVGQNVEYRFNPDGSVSTTPINVEGQPTPAPPKSDSVKQAPVPNASSPARGPWLVVALITAGLIAAGVWYKRKKRVE